MMAISGAIPSFRNSSGANLICYVGALQDGTLAITLVDGRKMLFCERSSHNRFINIFL